MSQVISVLYTMDLVNLTIQKTLYIIVGSLFLSMFKARELVTLRTQHLTPDNFFVSCNGI
jgi:hypothetical protein